MALGSGSSLATDCWIMRGGSPSSEKALKVGSATRLHQHSSSKPTAHSGWAAATSISRSRRLFSFVQGIGGGDPPLGPLPAYAQKTPERGAEGLPRDPLFGETLLEGSPGGHLQSPHAPRIPELSRRAVEHPPQPLGRVRVEGGMHALRSRGASDERIQALLVEGADGVANRLGGAPETLGYLGRRAAAGAGEQYLAAAHHEGLPGAQPCFEAFALLFRQFPDKYWRFHKRNYSPSHTTLSEDALDWFLVFQVAWRALLRGGLAGGLAPGLRGRFARNLCGLSMALAWRTTIPCGPTLSKGWHRHDQHHRSHNQRHHNQRNDARHHKRNLLL